MSTFDVNEEIDVLVDKLVEKLSKDLKSRLKRIVLKSEKIVLKQYIASQKTTSRPKRVKKNQKNP